MGNSIWMKWDGVHDSADQKKRLSAAKAAKTTPDSIDRDSLSGVFPGSGASPYQTTLTACTCRDYFVRRLPCKHIYRLAIELGVLNETAENGVNQNTFKSMQMTLQTAVGELENMTDDAQHIVRGFLCEALFHKKAEFYRYVDSITEQLHRCALLKSYDSGRNALSLLKRNQIIAILDQRGIVGFKRNSSHSNLLDWCFENVENFGEIIPKIDTFSFVDEFQTAQKSLYLYLLRKYEWDSFYDGNMERFRYPHGARSADVVITVKKNSDGSVDSTVKGNWDRYYFPDDEITRLLTLYGHNRCLDGFVAEPE